MHFKELSQALERIAIEFFSEKFGKVMEDVEPRRRFIWKANVKGERLESIVIDAHEKRTVPWLLDRLRSAIA